MGRKRVYINLEEYERLKKLGWKGKDIARVMGVSYTSLSLRLKEYNNGRTKTKNTK